MFGSSRETGRTSSDPAAEAFRTQGFAKFWEKFSDVHDISTDDVDYETIVSQRFEAFKKLPEVTKAIQTLAQEKNTEFLGRKFEPAELAAIGAELEALITTEQNFKVLDMLSEQVLVYRRIPAEIAQQKLKIAGMGSRDVLEHQAMGINHKIAKKENAIRDAEGSYEGMALAKEGVKTVKDLEKGVGLAEKVFLTEAENILGNFQKSFAQLERLRQDILAAERKSPEPGKIVIPENGSLKANFEEVNKNKKDPEVFLAALANFNFVANLESLKQGLKSACDGEIGELRKLKNKKKESAKYPNLQESIDKFDTLRGQVALVNVDTFFGSEAEGLQSDFTKLASINHGLGYLEGDPTNRRILRMVEDSTSGFHTSTGKNLGSSLKLGLTQLGEIQNRLEMSPVSQDDIKFSANYSRKGIMGRLVSRDPEKKLRKEARKNADDIENLGLQKEQIMARIDSIEDADFELNRMQQESDMAKQALSSTLKTFDRLFKKSADDAKVAINQQLASENPMDIIKAKQAIDKLIKAREDAPELYGAMDTDDDILDTSFHGNQNLRGVGKNYLDTLTVRIEEGVRKALESLSIDQADPDSLAAKLVAFEDGLGSLTETQQYKQVRVKAFKQVASRTSIFSAGKKAVLGQMLREASDRGFMTRDNIDLKGFVNAFRKKARQTV